MKLILFIACTIAFYTAFPQKNHEYKVVNTYHISSTGGWDYLIAHEGKLYVSHSTQVNILDESSGDSVGVILNTSGVHGIAFDDELGRGYTSNGRSNNVTVFNKSDNTVVTQVNTGENPDAIFYDPFSKMIITCNGRSKNLSVIDPKTNTIIATIDVGGKPETGVSDAKGKVFVNVEDKNEIVEVDMKSKTVLHHWSLNGGEGPTGLVYDAKTKRLFAGCEKKLVVMNATNGKIVQQLPIGDGCDGVAFDNVRKLVFTSNGEGNMSVIKEISADKYEVAGTYPTKRGARTIAINEKTGTIYMPTADMEATNQANGRPKLIPGTFQVLVIR
jgi:YVTN family beta-propeller protein